METFGTKIGSARIFDCCDKEWSEGMLVYNVGDSFEIILYCEEHTPDSFKTEEEAWH